MTTQISAFERNTFENQVIVITGAASGLGKAAAKLIQSRGATVISLDLNKEGLAASLFYLMAYGLTTLAAFGIIGLVRDSSGEVTDLNRWIGLGKKSPVVGAVFAFLLLSFAGIPLTSGFIGKFAIFSAAYQSGNIALVVTGVLASAIAAFFYIRVIIMIFFTDPVNDSVSVIIPSVKSRISITVATVISVVLGLAPSLLLNIAENFSTFIK